jgi:hypothetical protein
MTHLALTLVLLAAAFYGRGPAGEVDRDPPARIALERTDGHLAVRGIFFADQCFGELDYRLEVTKEGASGRSTSRQQGSFTPCGFEPDTLSAVRIGVQPGDRIEAVLAVTRGGEPIAEVITHEVID